MSFKITYFTANNDVSLIKLLKQFVFAIVIIFITTLLINNKVFAKNKTCDIFIINNNNKKIALNVEIADTNSSRTRGLMYRKNLEKNSGMLFIFKKEIILNFWMKNTYIPLSIAYADKKGVIIDIHLMHPLDTSIIYTSKTKSMFAVEVNQGWFKKNNISEGCRLDFNGCIGKQN